MNTTASEYSRRRFIRQASLTSLAIIALTNCTGRNRSRQAGPLTLNKDPQGYLDLPEGFSYKVIARAGDTMSDGLLVPGRADGMGTFLDEQGRTVIICNHENSPESEEHSPFGKSRERLERIEPERLYDSGNGLFPGLGGTTTLVFDEESGTLLRQHLSLAGTYRNCAGGVTPWGSWLSCEEDVTRADGTNILKDHGYVFEVPANHVGIADPIPLRDMGRFNHEAVAVDPVSGCIYLTEDRPDGLLYRFIPNEKENLSAGGRLQALVVSDRPSLDTRNWETTQVVKQEALSVHWIDLDGVEAPEDDLRYRGYEQGAARFARGEGIWMGEGEVFFACTNGGPKKFGQVFRYKTSAVEGQEGEAQQPGFLELFAESEDKSVLHMCDNLTIAPWGDILLCEDNGELNHIRGINREGEIYTLACNRSSRSELAGLVFSPSGKTLFVNVQENGDTVAITGPWEELAG